MSPASRPRSNVWAWWLERRGAVVWQGTVRVVTVVAPLGALAAARHAAESTLPGMMVVLVLALGVGAAIVPDSAAGLLVVATVGYFWVTEVDDRAGVASLVGALCLIVFHSATALAALMPVGGSADRVLAIRWLRRVGFVALGTCAGWGVSAAMVRVRPATNELLVAGALMVLIAGIWLLGSRGASRSTR